MSRTNGNGHDLYNVEAEEAVLGSLLIDPDAVLNLAPFLQGRDFYIQRNEFIYNAILALYHSQRRVDLVTLSDELKRHNRLDDIGGDAALTRLINATPSSLHAESYARIVERDAIKRRLLQAAGDIAKLAHSSKDPEEILSEAEGCLTRIFDNRGDQSLKTAAELTGSIYEHIERVSQIEGGLTGLPTGLSDLDNLLGGLQPSDNIVIAGRPGMGKTSLALQIGRNAAKKYGKKVMFFSLEMSGVQLTRRLMASEARIDAARLRTGQLAENEWPAFFQAQEAVAALPLVINDSSFLTPALLRSQAIRYHARHGLDLVIVDYLQLMSANSSGQNRNQEISEISRACKILARELDIPVIILSQLSRQVENRHNKRPMLSDLRDSGSIEANADVVLFLYLDEVYNPTTEFPNIAEIIVSKHRSGPTGTFSVYFKKALTEFADLIIRHYDFKQVDYEAH